MPSELWFRIYSHRLDFSMAGEGSPILWIKNWHLNMDRGLFEKLNVNLAGPVGVGSKSSTFFARPIQAACGNQQE
jgi:hypothetical protein